MMTNVLQRRLILGLVAVTLGVAPLLATMLLSQMASADDPGKPRGRNAAEPRASLTAQERAQQFKAGMRWESRARSGMTEAELLDFGDYPLFWLGDAFEGYNLQVARHVKYSAPPGAKSQDRVSFIYGECAPIAGANRCPVPAQVHVRPVCSVLPRDVAMDARLGGLQTLTGGAQLQRFADGHIMIWIATASVEVTVAANPSVVNRALAQLRGVGRSPHQPGEVLQPPDFTSCQS